MAANFMTKKPLFPLSTVLASNASLVTKTDPFVAVFVGGTAGIGSHTLRALTAHASANPNSNLRAYIIGRNEGAAKNIIDQCQAVCPTAEFRFLKADVSLLRETDRVCAEVVKLEEEETIQEGKGVKAKIDLLVMTQGFFSFQPRNETQEGLDMIMSLLYYSRMRCILQLLPLLLTSPLPAHIITVYSPVHEDKLIVSDLSLRETGNCTFWNRRSHVAYMTTSFFEKLAAQHPGKLSLVHYFPGFVARESALDPKEVPWWFAWTMWVAGAPLIRRLMVPQKECGERVLFLASESFPAGLKGDNNGGLDVAVASNGVVGGGAYRVNWDGGIVPVSKESQKFRDEGLVKLVWRHTMDAFSEIEAGRVFMG